MSLLCPAEPMELHLADNSTAISHQIVHLALKFSDGTMHIVEFRVVLALNHAIILEIPFQHKFNPSIDWENQTIT